MTDPISDVRAVAEEMLRESCGDIEFLDKWAARLTAACDRIEVSERLEEQAWREGAERDAAEIAALKARAAELDTMASGLLKMTMSLEAHPEGYDGPCFCALCRSYSDEGEQP